MKRKNKEKPAFQGCRVTQRVRNTSALNSDIAMENWPSNQVADYSKVPPHYS